MDGCMRLMNSGFVGGDTANLQIPFEGFRKTVRAFRTETISVLVAIVNSSVLVILSRVLKEETAAAFSGRLQNDIIIASYPCKRRLTKRLYSYETRFSSCLSSISVYCCFSVAHGPIEH